MTSKTTTDKQQQNNKEVSMHQLTMFRQSSNNIVSTMNLVLTEVEQHLQSIPEGESFNVDQYAKLNEKRFGVDRLLIATVIRTTVRHSGEYINKKGRSGGVVRAGEELNRLQERAEKLTAAAHRTTANIASLAERKAKASTNPPPRLSSVPPAAARPTAAPAKRGAKPPAVPAGNFEDNLEGSEASES